MQQKNQTMNNLAELQRRKAALQDKLEQQRRELKGTFIELRKEIEPANLLKKAVTGALGLSATQPTDAQPGILGKLPPALSFLADLFIKDPKWALVLKWLAPAAMKYLRRPKKEKVAPLQELSPDQLPTEGILEGELLEDALLEGTGKIPVKAKIYGQLRRGISSLRGALHKNDKTPEDNSEQPEN
jgi:hypothetical protein